MAKDPSMSELARMGSVKWAASCLGMSRDNFYRKRETLENDGFPKPDRITNLYIKADIDAWINRRRQLSDDIVLSVGVKSSLEEVNFGAL